MPEPMATACQSPFRFASASRTSVSRDVFMPRSISTKCYVGKHQIDIPFAQSFAMDETAISDVVALNLRHFMAQRKLTQQVLAKKSGMAQTTISLYLNPSSRKETGKADPPAPNLGKVNALAGALGVELWELLRPLTQSQRDLIKNVDRVIADQVAQASAVKQPAVIPLIAKPRRKRLDSRRYAVIELDASKSNKKVK